VKISELRDTYYEATDKVSELVRQLAFAGIAVIWIFRVGSDSGGIKYSDQLLLPLGLLVLSLAADFSQYFYKSLVWGILNHIYWRSRRDNEADVDVSGKWNWPTIALFWCKACLMAAAYITLLRFIVLQLRQPA
jgi:hypothetical protein